MPQRLHPLPVVAGEGGRGHDAGPRGLWDNGPVGSAVVEMRGGGRLLWAGDPAGGKRPERHTRTAPSDSECENCWTA